MTEKNSTHSEYRDLSGPSNMKSDPTHGFMRALDSANREGGPGGSELPNIFPRSVESVEEKVVETIDGIPKKEDVPSLAMSNNFTAKYARFNMDDPLDVSKLEAINNHIMKDGWLPAREEWVHTKDGGTFVILKYLERVKSEKENPEEKAESYGFGR